jgi:hypothetical protein
MSLYLVMAILFLVGGGILLFVIKNTIETVVFIRSASKTVGQVIRLATTRNSDGHTLYLPVFQYRTNDGSLHEYTSTVASKPPAYQIGATATLFYLRKNPQNAKLRSFSELWLLNLILALVGSTLCAGGVQLFLYLR